MRETDLTQNDYPSRRRLMAMAALVVIACAVTLTATSPGLPMTWDEGNAIDRADGIIRWLGRLGNTEKDEQLGAFHPEAIAQDWQYTTQIEGHPAFYGIVIALGRAVSGGWLGPLDAARFGPMLLFALAAGCMFYRTARDFSTVAGIGAVAALLLLPRMFAHAHFASFDGPLTSCWIMAWALFPAALERRRYALLWGIVLGMTLGCKATGWLAPLPFMVWAGCYRGRGAWRALAIGLPTALATFYLLNPPLWHEPIDGLVTFFWLNTHRGAFNISTWFLGRMYNLDHPLPWYNTLFWTAITVPPGTLFLAAVGLVHLVRCRTKTARPAGMLVVGNWLVLMIVRATPFAPPHDGVRLFLPCFAFLAVLAGVGCARLVGRVGDATLARRQCHPDALRKHNSTQDLGNGRSFRIRSAVVVFLYLGSLSSLVCYAPQWLSYYNLLIGGLPGATAVGMEPTYYWDGLDRSTLDWLDRHTGQREKVCFSAASTENLVLMHRWKTLPVEFRAHAPGSYRWYVIQHRPSGWQAVDRRLIEHGRPAMVKTIGRSGWGPWRLDVPLVTVYPYPQYERFRASVDAAR